MPPDCCDTYYYLIWYAATSVACSYLVHRNSLRHTAALQLLAKIKIIFVSLQETTVTALG